MVAVGAIVSWFLVETAIHADHHCVTITASLLQINWM
jgi:hypothetical protein